MSADAPDTITGSRVRSKLSKMRLARGPARGEMLISELENILAQSVEAVMELREVGNKLRFVIVRAQGALKDIRGDK